jgi:ATP adenylyltransferase
MNILWAAWRRDFILGPKEEGCVFCNRIKQRSDKKNLILHRAKKNIVIMNKYPYNSGHLMVVPKSHHGFIHELSKSEWDEMHQLTRICIDVLKDVMPVDGFNIGMNLGAAAGAGIRDHIHNHIVPRFTGDGNFMAVTSDTHIQSFAMLEIYDLLKPGFNKLKGEI